MGGCSAPNCTNHSRKKYRMFKFPNDPDRRRKWIINCGRDGWLPGNSSELCSGHFEESQFEAKRADNWKKLKPNAVPTLFNIPNPPAVFAFDHDKREKFSKPKLISSHHLVDDAIDTIAESPDTLLERKTYLESENKTLKLELESNKRIISFLCDKKIIFSGKPSANPLHPVYTPSIFSFNEDSVKIGQKLLKQYEKNLKHSQNEECLRSNCEAKPDTQHRDHKPSVIKSNQQRSLLRPNVNVESSENEKSLRTSCKAADKDQTSLLQSESSPKLLKSVECCETNSKGKPLTDPQHLNYELTTCNNKRNLLQHNYCGKRLENGESLKITEKSPTDPQIPDCVSSVYTFKQPRSFLQYKRNMDSANKEESGENSYKESSCEASCSFDPVVPSMDIDSNSVGTIDHSDRNPDQKRDVATMTDITMQHVSKMGEENMDLRKKITTLENTLEQLKLLNNHI